MKLSHTENKKFLKIGAIILIFGLGFVISWFSHISPEIRPVTSIRENSSGYKFINPFILLKIPDEDTSPQFLALKNQIATYVNKSFTEKNAKNVSVYFRELNSISWISVNGDEKYSPASMLKVASLIAFFRAVEIDPNLIHKEIRIAAGSLNSDTKQDYYVPTNPVKMGEIYTAKELLSRVAIDSDNNAANVLSILAGKYLMDKTYTDLGIPLSVISSTEDFISPRLYSRFFRALYNGTYLSHDLSEQTLELLSKANFKNGLVAGVPSNTLVSHKFGERTFLIKHNSNIYPDETIRELHDCGIIYFPNNPYVLCIMTKGTDFSKLETIMKNISSIAWNAVSAFDDLKK